MFGGNLMAIRPPSDIVLDVLNAADPASLQEAQAKLKAGQAVTSAQRLANTAASFDANIDRSEMRSGVTPGHQMHARNKDVPETYRKFEGMVLQTFLKSMMPDSEDIYGKGATGEIWKGMMAQQLGDKIADSGGIGIADMLARANSRSGKENAEFEKLNRAHSNHMATQMIEQNEMKAFDKLLPTADADSAS
jgi:Rod binding domain-containing protein